MQFSSLFLILLHNFLSFISSRLCQFTGNALRLIASVLLKIKATATPPLSDANTIPHGPCVYAGVCGGGRRAHSHTHTHTHMYACIYTHILVCTYTHIPGCWIVMKPVLSYPTNKCSGWMPLELPVCLPVNQKTWAKDMQMLPVCWHAPPSYCRPAYLNDNWIRKGMPL